VNVDEEVLKTLRSVLSVGSTGAHIDPGSALLGSIAELDSMAVVSILTALEEKFGFSIDDDEIDGRTFASVQSLTHFVRSKLMDR
jgi:acyl carrier protein